MARQTKVQEELDKERIAKIRAQAQLRAQNRYMLKLEAILAAKGGN